MSPEGIFLSLGRIAAFFFYEVKLSSRNINRQSLSVYSQSQSKLGLILSSRDLGTRLNRVVYFIHHYTTVIPPMVFNYISLIFLPCQQTVRFSQKNRIIWYNSYTNSFMKLIKCLTRRFVLSFCHIVVSLPCFLLSILLQFSSFLVSIQVIPGETSVTLKKSTLPK